MGARNNVILHYGTQAEPSQDRRIYIYGHWIGDGWAIEDALKAARPRWGDEPYSARVIIQTLLPAVDPDASDQTGFGISTFECDQDLGYQPVHIWLAEQIIVVGKHQWSFEAYLEQAAVR